jgi:UDP-N-acetylglucosamine 2-epimerase (non-hydrolysing)
MRIQIILGTRPEAIKLYPVILGLKSLPACDVQLHVTVSGQHRQMLDQFLHITGLQPDADLNVMRVDQKLDLTTSKLFSKMHPVISAFNPDIIMVQGDTLTAFVGAMIGFHHQAKIAHVEAGLRSDNLASPWPEEGYRQMISRIADWHFAPTEIAQQNLLSEGIDPQKIHVTGNTVVEALGMFRDKLKNSTDFRAKLAKQFAFLNPAKKMILVTMHRRENHGDGVAGICKALRILSARDDVQIVLPIHQNPKVRGPVTQALQGCDNIHLLGPQEYIPFVYLMEHSHIILTDSGGVQEEAPSFHKPVLVLRDTTERPEGIAAGVAKLVGTNSDVIVKQATALLDGKTYAAMSHGKSPYGDGKASARIIDILRGDSITPEAQKQTASCKEFA